MAVTQGISHSELMTTEQDGSEQDWLCENDDSLLRLFRSEEDYGWDVGAWKILRGQCYQHGLPMSPDKPPSEPQFAMTYQSVPGSTDDLQKKALKQRKKGPSGSTDLHDVAPNSKKKCDYPKCDKDFIRDEHLKRHKQSFHGEGTNRFGCEFCGKNQFNRRDNLNYHRKLHARPKGSKRRVEFIAAAVPVIEQEERGRKKRAPLKSGTPSTKASS